MVQKSKRKKINQDVDEPAFESDEYFAYIAGYTDGGFPYGITWEEAREIAIHDPHFGKDLGLNNSRGIENNKSIVFP